MPSVIIETKSFQNVQAKLTACAKDAIILVDVDNTIITPKSLLFRSSSPYRNIVDDIKANKYPFLDTEKIVSTWRVERQSMLVDDAWPELIKQIHSLATPIFAFTHMGTGRYGIIDSLEIWRYNELKSYDITFTEEFLGDSEMTLMPHTHQMCGGAIFYKGIFMTGDYNKVLVLLKILDLYKPSQVVVVDDLHDNVTSLQQVCLEKSVPYTGIVFRGVDKIPGTPNEKVAAVQKKYLLEQGKWLEDDEASKLIL